MKNTAAAALVPLLLLLPMTWTLASPAEPEPSKDAITAPELARFLGVEAWRTTVALPPNSFTVDILEVNDGKLGEVWLQQGDQVARKPQPGLLLMLGAHEGCYRLTLTASTGTLGVVTKVPLFPHTLSSALPSEIGVGDHIFFGQPAKDYRHQDDPASYQRGFLLRVRIKQLSETEAARAERCLANARQLAAACQRFARDHAGRFPTKAEELEAGYLPGNAREALICPLASEPHKMGYELCGGKDTDGGAQVLVRGRFTASDGRRSVVYVNQWGALEWR